MLDYEWILVVFGLTMIVTMSKVMEPVRALGAKLHPLLGGLLKCPMCFGFWAGAAINLMDYSHYGDYTSWGLVFDGFLGSATSHILYTLTRFLDKEF